MRKALGILAAFFIAVPAAEGRTVSSTAYCSPQPTAAGPAARFGWVAENSLPLRSVIRLTNPRHGIFDRQTRRYRIRFLVMDRIGSGSSLDFFIPWGSESHCAWGRRTVSFVVERYGR